MIQVRNALQALQGLAASNTAMGTLYPYSLPAHSNPNLPDNSFRHGNMMTLPRSSSHPPEIFSWNSGEHIVGSNASNMTEKGTQTDELVHFLEHFVVQNPHHVLRILGLDPDVILSGRRVSPPPPLPPAGNPARASDTTFPTNTVVNMRNHSCNHVTSMSINHSTDWICQHRHRFSAGDIDDKLRENSSLPATRSLKFHPFTG